VKKLKKLMTLLLDIGILADTFAVAANDCEEDTLEQADSTGKKSLDDPRGPAPRSGEGGGSGDGGVPG